MDSSYGVASDRLVNAASAYEMNDPRLRGLLETSTRAMGVMPFSQMGATSQQEIKAIVSMVLNQMGFSPGQNDFYNMHRAVMQAGAGGYSLTNAGGGMIGMASPGAGNISAAAASQIAGGVTDRLSSFVANREGFRDSYDSGNMNGLSQTTAIQMASRVMAKRRFQTGDIQMLDFGTAKATDASGKEVSVMEGTGDMRHATGYGMKTYLDSLTNKGGAYEGRKFSAEFQEMYRQAEILRQRDKYVKDHGDIFGGQLNLSNEKHREAIEKFYSEGLKDRHGKHMELSEADRMGIEALDKGNGKSFVVANNVTKDVTEAIKKASSNVAELSKIFNTDDLDELQTIADSMGMAALTEENKVKSVRDAISRAKVTAQMTGKSVKEVMDEQAGIVSSFQMAGRSVSNTMASAVQESVNASEGNGGWKTKEQREGEAMRSQEDANEYLRDVVVLEQMTKDGSLTAEDQKEALALLERVNSGKSSHAQLDADIALSQQIIGRSNNADMANNDAYVNNAFKNSSMNTLGITQAAAHPENYESDLPSTWESRWDSDTGKFKGDAYMNEKLKQNGGDHNAAIQSGKEEILAFQKAFGTGQDTVRSDLLKIVQGTADPKERAEKIKALREGLVKRNATGEQLQNFDAAADIASKWSQEAATDVGGLMNTYAVNNATASQDTTGMDYQLKHRDSSNRAALNDLRSHVVHRAEKGIYGAFEQGIDDKTGRGEDLTAEEALAVNIGRAKTRTKNGKRIDIVNEVAELDENGAVKKGEDGKPILKQVTSYNAGQLNVDDLAKNGGVKEGSDLYKAIMGAAGGLSEEKRAKLSSKISEASDYGMLSSIMKDYGLIGSESDAGDFLVTSQEDAELIRSDENERNKKLGLKGWKSFAEQAFGKDNSFRVTTTQAKRYLQDKDGNFRRDASGKKIINKNANADLARVQITKDKYVYFNTEGKMTDINGRELDGEEQDDIIAAAKAEGADVANLMYSAVKDKSDGAEGLIEMAKNTPGMGNFAQLLKDGRGTNAGALLEEAKDKIGWEFHDHDKNKARAASNRGDAQGILSAVIDDKLDTDLEDPKKIKERNKVLGLFLKAQEEAAEGNLGTSDNAYLSKLKELGLIENKKGEWVTTDAASAQFGKIVGSGKELFGSDKDHIRDALGDKLSLVAKDAISPADDKAMKEEHARKVAEEFQMRTAKHLENIAHNLWALADEETSHARNPSS